MGDLRHPVLAWAVGYFDSYPILLSGFIDPAAEYAILSSDGSVRVPEVATFNTYEEFEKCVRGDWERVRELKVAE